MKHHGCNLLVFAIPCNMTSIVHKRNVSETIFNFFFQTIGYRFLRISLFTESLAVSAFATYAVCKFYSGLLFPSLLGVSLFVGVVFAVLATLVSICGLFILGFVLGAFTLLFFILAISPLVVIPSKWIVITILVVPGLFSALLILKFQKFLVVLSTSIMGAALISLATDFFFEEFLLVDYAWQIISVDDKIELCWLSWTIFAIWPLLFGIGSFFQIKVTGRHVEHNGKGTIYILLKLYKAKRNKKNC